MWYRLVFLSIVNSYCVSINYTEVLVFLYACSKYYLELDYLRCFIQINLDKNRLCSEVDPNKHG